MFNDGDLVRVKPWEEARRCFGFMSARGYMCGHVYKYRGSDGNVRDLEPVGDSPDTGLWLFSDDMLEPADPHDDDDDAPDIDLDSLMKLLF